MKLLAYLDAGTGSLILQAVLGGAAGAAVLLKSTGRKLFRRSDTDQDSESAETEGSDAPSASTEPVDERSD